jgi:hypothetical protein
MNKPLQEKNKRLKKKMKRGVGGGAVRNTAVSPLLFLCSLLLCLLLACFYFERKRACGVSCFHVFFFKYKCCALIIVSRYSRIRVGGASCRVSLVWWICSHPYP